MANNSEITTIRIPRSLKDELKDMALPKEPMHLTIQRLISENQQLKKADERNDALIEMYKFRTSQIGDLNVKSQFLNGVLENDFDNYNSFLDAYRRLSGVLLDVDAPKDELYQQLKDAYDVCLDEIGDEDIITVIDFVKVYCYDEFGLLAKLEDEMCGE